MNQSDKPASRADVEEIITKAVGNATSQILTAVGDQFTIVIDQLDEIGTDTTHIKNKLDVTADKTDDHTGRISKLEKAANIS